MLVVIVLSFSILIFPIFLALEVKYEDKVKKIIYNVKFFNLIKLLYGYVEKVQEGIAIHLNKRTAIIISYDKIFDMRNKIKPLKDYHVVGFRIQLDIGIEESLTSSLAIANSFNFVYQYIQWFFTNTKPYVSLYKEINVYENENLFKLKTKGYFVFNLLMIIISLIKILMEKIYYAIKNRKQQNKQGD